VNRRRHSHYDVSRHSRAYGARSPPSHHDVILIVTPFTTELATPTVRDERTDTLPCLMYKHDDDDDDDDDDD